MSNFWISKTRRNCASVLSITLTTLFLCACGEQDAHENFSQETPDVPASQNNNTTVNPTQTDSNSSNNRTPTDIDETGQAPSTPPIEDEEPGLRIRFEPFAEDFYRMPWPSDYRVTDQGTVDLSDFPQAEQFFIKRYSSEFKNVHGFSTIPVIYAALNADPGLASIPDPVESLQPDSPLQLIELGPGCGRRIPIESKFDLEGDPFAVPMLLQSSPVPGFVLKPRTPYAWVVLKHFGAAAGLRTHAPSVLDSLLSDGVGDNPFLYATYEPLRECLENSGLSRQSVAMATVFTTQDPITETRLMREVVLDRQKTATPTVKSWDYWHEVSHNRHYSSWRGTYDTPIFQRGTSPYTNSGGGLVFDEEGMPTIQRWEEVPFAITFPDPQPGPHPILFWMGGTGATLQSHLQRDHVLGALDAGFVVMTFAAQFHDSRAVPGSEVDRSAIQILNPEASRTTLRQQVADTSYFVRMIRETLPDLENMPALDVDTIVYGGQSQGAMSGSLLAAVEPAFQAYAFNGIGGYLSATMIHRKDPADFVEVLQTLLDIDRDIDRFHPLIQLAQLGGDTIDALNYAPYWRGWEGNPGGAHMLIVNGKLDHAMPYQGINALAIAGNVPTLSPEGWTVDPWGLWNVPPASPPFSGNQHALNGAPLTMGHYLNPDEGHFTIYREPRAANLVVNFWISALQGPPTISFE